MLMMQKNYGKMCGKGNNRNTCGTQHTKLVLYSQKNFSQEERRFLLKNLCEIFQISDLNEKKIVAALENNAFSDFEDGLQEECAVESMADYIVTRNPADFKHSRVKVILPDELLRELEKN